MQRATANPKVEQAQHKAERSAEHLQQEAEQAASDIRNAAAEAAQESKQAAQEAMDSLYHSGAEIVRQQKDYVADELSHCGKAAHRAAESFEEEGDPRAARYAHLFADQIDDVAGYLHNRGVGGMLSDLEDFARRRPEIVFGGMFLVGLAASRFLKAAPSDESSTRTSGAAPLHRPHSDVHGGAPQYDPDAASRKSADICDADAYDARI